MIRLTIRLEFAATDPADEAALAEEARFGYAFGSALAQAIEALTELNVRVREDSVRVRELWPAHVPDDELRVGAD